MKKALISPLEPRETGYRVAEVAASSFEVCLPFFWADCGDDVAADQFWFDPQDETFKPITYVAVAQAAEDQPQVTGAQTL